MRRKLALVAAVVASTVWAQLQLGGALPDAAPAPPAAALARPAALPAKPAAVVEPAPAGLVARTSAGPVAVAGRPQIEAEPLTPEQAQAMMGELAVQGDPRQPAAGGLRPRLAANPAQLADAEQYSAFEAAARRREVQAWTLGLQQIPHIRARIDEAALSGERNPAELAEAGQALEQLELLQQSLQQSDPQLLQAPAGLSD